MEGWLEVFRQVLGKLEIMSLNGGDQIAESFVFSLTNGDKFVLQDQNYAFRYFTGYGPMFGNSKGIDFFITNKANNKR